MRHHSFAVPAVMGLIFMQDLSCIHTAQSPRFIYEPPSFHGFSNSTGGSLTCSAHGLPTPRLTWVDGKEQPVRTVPGLRHVLENGTLIFPPFPPQDYDSSIHEQEYRCVITNTAGTIVSRQARVRAVIWNEYRVNVYNVFVERGNVAVLHCGIPASVKDNVEIVGWWKDEGQYGRVELHTGGRYLITTHGDLHIRDVSKNDENTQYKCQYRDNFIGRTFFSEEGNLIVTETLGSSLSKPETASSVFKVREGGAIDLPCIARGFPLPEYTWYKINPLTGAQEQLSATPTIFPRHTVLSVVGATSSDSGRYLCRVHNQVNQYMVEHVLEVTSPLSTHIFPPHQVTDSGRTAVFNCTVDGFPVLNVYWLKNGAILIPSAKINPGTTSLVIKDVTRDDSGMYQCVAGNEEEESQASAQLILGDVPPVFHFKFSEQTLREGPAVSLKCTASGNPPPTISWFVDDELISITDRFDFLNARGSSFVDRIVIGQYLNHDGIVISHLNISSVRTSDGGLYKCIASNTIERVGHTSRLNVYGKPSSRGVVNLTAVSKKDILLICPVSGYPIERVEWKMNTKVLKGPRPAPLSNGTLLIRAVEKEDSKKYSCTAFNTQGDQATAHILLKAIEPPKISPFTFDGDLKEGDRSQVSCTISSGDMPIDIKWEKDGRVFEPATDVQVQNNVFSSNILFFSLKAVHSGTYTCIAINAADATNFTAQLIVRVPPKWEIEPQDLTIVHKDLAIINCHASGNPRPTISWRKSVGVETDFFQYVQTSSGNIAFHPNGSLVIKSVGQEDEGYYRCEVQNGVGEMSKTIMLDVKVPVYFEVNSVNRTAIVSQNAALVCNAFGDQPISIVWRLGHSQIYSNTERYSIVEANSSTGVMNTLTISDVTRADGREFACIASNKFGSKSLPVYLSVYEPPEPPTNVYITEVSSRSISLAWYPAFDGNSPVLHYMVQYKERASPWREQNNRTVGGAASAVVVTDLVPYTEYQLHVVSVNSIGAGPPSKVVTAITSEEVPSGPPKSVRVEAISGTQLRVTWHPPRLADRNGRVLGYYIRYGKLGSETLSKQTIRDEDVQQTIISNLTPFTKYEVMVSPFNKIGPGPTSSKNIVSTLEGAPDGPPQLVQCDPISPTSISISWKAPSVEDRNGIILGYLITYRLENKIGGKDTIHSKKTGGMQATVDGLEIFESYYIKVSAFTKVGTGVRSDKLICTTAADVPSAPQDIKAASINSDTILVSWKEPERKNGEILSYTLYKQHERMVSTVTIPGSERQFTFKGLLQRQHYEFWIVAHTIIGEGTRSKVTSSSPMDEAPARITSFSSDIFYPQSQSISLPCHTIGSPPPRLSWIHNNKLVHSGEQYQVLSDGTLVVKNIRENMDSLSCQVENMYGKDQISYSIRVVRSPVAPTIRVSKITTSSITLTWSSPHNGGALIQGYFLNTKRNSDSWEEISLDYDLLAYRLANLSCGSVYSFNLVAHNIAGRSKPSATITTPTLGSVPQEVKMDRIITANITFITLHLHRWPDGGCPIHYYVIEYKEEWQPTWRIVSNNIRSEEENIIISDLLPSTWYSLQLTAHNGAGSKVVTTQFSTLSPTGQTLVPRPDTAPTEAPGIQQSVDGSIAIPVISSILITSTLLLIAVYVFRKRRYLGLGRYAGYTQGSSEYSVKSLTEREAAKIIDPSRVHLFSPHSLHSKQSDQKVNITTTDASNPYEALPYATYRRPNPKTHPLTAYPSNTLEYSQHFQTFGRHESYQGQGCPHPDLLTKNCYKTAVWDSKSLGKDNANMDQLESSLEISCISNQHTLPMSTVHMLNNSKDRMVETRFSLPANVFLQPNFGCGDIPSTSPESFVNGKYATLGRIKKTNHHKGNVGHKAL